jgi:hypothetical protein
MLAEIDRVLIATPDANASAQAWKDRVGAVEVSTDRIASLAGRRITLRAGTSDIEIIEPDGSGLVADELKRRGRAHLFAAGASSPDPEAVARTAAASGANVTSEGHRHTITLTMEGAPIRFVISPQAKRERAGLLDFLYEATVLAENQAQAVEQITKTFALNPASFTTITSEKFGYTGVLTLFEAGRLHRFEVITPTDMDKTMGRFYCRERCSFYMAFAESAAMPAIEKSANGNHITIDRPATRSADKSSDQLWLHPQALGGMMLGVSRPTMAWMWSGQPQRVASID